MAAASVPLTLLIGFPGGWEALVILLVVLILFGSKLPLVARNVGRSFTEFKRGVKGIDDDSNPSAAITEDRDRPGSTVESGAEARKRG